MREKRTSCLVAKDLSPIRLTNARVTLSSTRGFEAPLLPWMTAAAEAPFPAVHWTHQKLPNSGLLVRSAPFFVFLIVGASSLSDAELLGHCRRCSQSVLLILFSQCACRLTGGSTLGVYQLGIGKELISSAVILLAKIMSSSILVRGGAVGQYAST